MTVRKSIRDDERKVPPKPCIHCAKGWIYEADEETGEDVAYECHMCRGMLDAQHSGLERLDS